MEHIVKIIDTKGEVNGPYYFRGLADRNLVFDNFNPDFPFYITILADDIRAGVDLDSFKIGIKKRKWYQFWKPERQRYLLPVIFKLDEILNISSKQSIKVSLPNGQHFFIVKNIEDIILKFTKDDSHRLNEKCPYGKDCQIGSTYCKEKCTGKLLNENKIRGEIICHRGN